MRVRSLALLLLIGGVAMAAPVHYALTIAVSVDGTISGEAIISSTAPADWPEAVVRLYPAALDRTSLVLTGAWVDGEEVDWESIEPSTATVSLSASAGQTFSMTLAFAGRVPEFGQALGYGTFARSPHAIVLAQAYPILAPWDEGWVVHPVFPWGDAVVADVADYCLDLTIPDGWIAVASGMEEEIAPGRYRVEGMNLREMAIVVLRGYESQAVTAGEVAVRSFTRPEHRQAGQAALRITAQALDVFVERLGPHPFPDLDVVAVPLRAAAGVEYPRLILAGEVYYERYPSDSLFFPMIFAHEVAHQWWYAEVGNDQIAEPWVDEALATYTSGLYFEAQGRFPEILRYWESGYAGGQLQNRTARVTSPLWEFPSGSGYGGIVYSGGALFFQSVRERIGDGAFFGALRRYRREFQWQLANGEDLLRVLAEESPQPLDDLFVIWLGL
ncbi:MAG: hypothetical protein BIP78_0279 [Candidatus Bipolaricaulis sibiricus]|uniref:Peptidase M1 membrane alanine aminopeptidase domain-containing protein n=1 Tax=Bipolaricaulis sibiricus TaxID=2501609 RepID=A0A410FSL1_BIPS1|nr:MAG: hypothetical protein BIP78_0279 [Candidatus Bipolaricaulis sibiricus]